MSQNLKKFLLKVKFLCVGILIKIENLVWKLEKCPTFAIFYRNFAMFPTLGKQVQKSDNEVF